MRIKRRSVIPRWMLALGDMALVNAGFVLAFYFRFGGRFPEENYEPFVRLAPVLTVVALLVFSGLRFYSSTPGPFLDTVKVALVGSAVLALVTMALTYWARGFALPRSVVSLGVLIQPVLLVTWRAVFWYVDRWWHGERPILVVTGAVAGKAGTPAGPAHDEELSLIGKILHVPRGWFRLEGVCPWWDEDSLVFKLARVDALVIAPSVPPEEKAHLVAQALRHGVEVFVIPDLYDILLLNARVGQVDDLPVLAVTSLGLAPTQAFVKRLVDLGLALAALLVSSPVLLVNALLVKATSPGPVLLRQERIGRGGRVFTLYKFRTMVKEAEAMTGPVLATADDPRVTRVGRFLRATRLDELPQIINVLRGEMSLVGPRPERPHFIERFQREMSDYDYRLLVKPGITGLAQVMGKYSTTAADKLRYDLYYIRNYSLFLDLKILVHTLRVVLSREAARGVDMGMEEQAAATEFLRRSAGK